MNADGSGQTRLTSGPDTNSYPSWQGDGPNGYKTDY